jgi:hypothetical protein
LEDAKALSLNTYGLLTAGLPDFLATTYQNGEKYTKLSNNISNGNKIYKMAVK